MSVKYSMTKEKIAKVSKNANIFPKIKHAYKNVLPKIIFIKINTAFHFLISVIIKLYIVEKGNNVCVEKFPSKYVKESNHTECELDTEICYYNETGDNRVCYKSCPSDKFCYDGDFQIRESCGDNFKYHTQKGNICYNSCALIPEIGGKYYEEDNI